MAHVMERWLSTYFLCGNTTFISPGTLSVADYEFTIVHATKIGLCISVARFILSFPFPSPLPNLVFSLLCSSSEEPG